MPVQYFNKIPSKNSYRISKADYLDIARNVRPDSNAINLFGFNRTIETGYETVMNDGGGLYSFPGSALTMSAVSDSASDTMQLYIEGLDASYAPVNDTITLTGTSAVTTNVDFFRINDARILSGSNVGNITISNGGTTYAYIEAGTGVHQALVYTTQAGVSLYVTQVDFTSGTINPNKYMTARAKMTSGGTTVVFFESSFVTSQLSFDMQVPFRIPEKTDFTLEAKSSSGSNELSIFLNGILIED
jgi:hypothetical protein